MAEVTGMRNNALPYPVYGAPWAVVFPMLDADGDLVTGATTPDAERSLNGDTFADCTNESTEIATNSGVYYLLLTGAEMTADIVAVIAKSASAGMKTTVLTFYPRKLVSLRAGTVGANAADGTTLQLDSSAVAIDDYYNGCLLVAVIDSVTEARVISDYVGSTKVCTVSPAFNTSPDNNDTFTVYLPEGRQITQSDAFGWNGTAVATPHTAGYPVVTVKDGTGTGEIDTSSGVVLAKDHTGANLATASALDTVDDFLDTEIAAIKAKTDNLPSDPADASDIASAFSTVNTKLDTIDDFLDTEVAAIKAKTDNLPSDPADASDIASSFSTVNTKLDTIDDFLDTEIAAIKAKTDNLPSDPADASDIAASFSTVNTKLDTIDDFVDTEVAAIKAKTDNLPSDPADASDIASAFGTVNTTLGAIVGYLDTEILAIKAKTDNLPSDPADQSAVEAAILAAWTTALTESYNADGAAPTPAQALFVIMQMLTEMNIIGTTMTVKKLDGTTTALTLTLDSATTPTSITRAS